MKKFIAVLILVVAAIGMVGCDLLFFSQYTVTVSSYSLEYVEIYVDNDYEGTISPYGYLDVSVSGGSHTFYGESDNQFWGPETIYITDDYFVWRIFP